jgi:hypothetical protein
MSRSQLGWLSLAGLAAVWVGFRMLACGSAMASGTPGASGLMIHVPFDGSFTDARALGAVRPEAEANPEFVEGVKGKAAISESGHRCIGRLHVSRLAKVALLGRTPAAGTIMLWYKFVSGKAAAGDSAVVVLVTGDSPLNLTVGITGSHPTLTASFNDDAGTTHRIGAPITASPAADSSGNSPAPIESWHHLALAWDSESGRITAFVQGEQVAETAEGPFKMPGLPKVFELGAPGVALDEFRLYKHRLDLPALRSAAGL